MQYYQEIVMKMIPDMLLKKAYVNRKTHNDTLLVMNSPPQSLDLQVIKVCVCVCVRGGGT